MKNAQFLSALPAFEATTRLGSFTRAAKELGLTQSALSRRIQALEQGLGVALFSRRGRSLTITGDGLRLAEAARSALQLVENTRRELGGPVSCAIRGGRLVPLAPAWNTGAAYAAVASSAAFSRPAVFALVDWIVAEAAN
jgi:LysR family transcriptional regulator, glycine cleavage system transcriptional activator